MDYEKLAKQFGGTVQSTNDLDSLAKKFGGVTAGPAQVSQPSGFQSLAQSIAKPFLKIPASIQAVGRGASGLVEYGLGNKEKANKLFAEQDVITQEGADFGVLGKVKPLSSMKEAVATGLDVGSSIAGGFGGVAKTIGGKALQFGTLSAVGGAGQAIADDKSAEEVAKNAFISGLSGAALGTGVGIIGKIAQKFASKAPEAIYNSSLKVLNKIKSAGKSPSKFLADKGVWGNLGTFKKASEEGMKKADDIITAKVAKVPGGATFGELKNSATSLLQKDLGENLFSPQAVKSLIDDVPVEALKKKGILNWQEINTVRSELGKLIGDNKWIMTNPSEKVKAAQAMYRSMASLIQKVTKTSDDFAQYSKWIQTKKAVDRAIDLADSKFGLGFYDIASGGLGAIAGGVAGQGSITDRLKSAAVFGAAGLGAERLLNSPAVRTGIAQAIQKLGRLPTDTAGKVSRTAVIELFNQALSNSNPQ